MRSFALFILCGGLMACSKSGDSSSGTAASNDTSASGIAANAVGASLAGSDSGGTLALNERYPRLIEALLPRAYASTACPTVLTANGSGCTNSSNDVNLTYSGCSFGSSGATWSGLAQVSLSSGSAITCGTFPTLSSIGNNQSIQRQYLTSGSPGTATRTSSRGTSVTIDCASSNLNNFDTGTTIAANIGSGYGSQVVFDGSGNRKQLILRERIYSSGFDHSISGALTATEASGNHTINGPITVYHNKLRVVGTTQFANVVYNNSCCYPVSGKITTSFAAGAHVSPTAAGALVVGRSETLEFVSCGNATLTNAAGDSLSVYEDSCI